MVYILVSLLQTTIRVFIFIVIVNAVLSYVLLPDHPLRVMLDRLVNPFLNPIRRLMPSTMAVDFSPTLLIFALVIVEQILLNLLYTLR
jgi:YggT family protein